MKNKEDAEDITQEVFVYVYQKISDLKEPAAFPSWINKITANKCTNALTRNKRPLDIDLDEIGETTFVEESDPLLLPDQALENIETARLVSDIIDNLPLPQKVCIYYYYYEHLTIAQIAENLDTNENTVKSRLSLSKEKIRKEVEKLNEKEGIKLFSVSPLMIAPLLKLILNDYQMPLDTMNSILAKVSTGAGVAAGTGAAVGSVATGASSSAVGTSTGTAAKTAATLGIKAKIAMAVAGVVATAGIGENGKTTFEEISKGGDFVAVIK